MSARRLVIFTDGGARGNPGPGAAGAVIKDAGGEVLREISHYLGHVTNNQAEYQAVIDALEAAAAYAPDDVRVFLDSELIAHQLNGRYKVRHPNMKPLYERVQRLVGQLHTVSFTHVPRARNAHADRLVNRAIDEALHKPPRPSH